MRHGDDGAGIFLQMPFQPGDRFGVEMVGRLVEQQQIGLLQAASCTGRRGAVRRRRGSATWRRRAAAAWRPWRFRAGDRAPRRWRRRWRPARGSNLVVQLSPFRRPERLAEFRLPSSSLRLSKARVGATASSMLPRTSLVSSRRGSCGTKPTREAGRQAGPCRGSPCPPGP